jgi:IclR family transcriptional regulator, KDG regulon repressor
MATIERAARDQRRPSFQVLERTFAILDVFDEEYPEWSTTDIARSLGLPIPTVHRILTALKRQGYVSQHDESKRFRLGVAALRLGDRARTVVDLRSVAMPELRKLSKHTGETALLTVLTPGRDHGVCLERVETAHPLRLSVTPGRQLPLHAGASQKVLLAYLDDDEVDRVIAGGLAHLCHATITDPRLLRDELATIRRRGWASSYEETNVGVWGVAVPVLNAHAEIVCAVGIAGPSARLSSQHAREDVRRVHAAATAIGGALGLNVPEMSAASSSIKPKARRSNERKGA